MTAARNRLSGYLYVVRFESGLVKVGCGVDYAPRVGQHIAGGVRHGNPCTVLWTSSEVPRMAAAERALLQWCKCRPGVEKLGKEWFRGLYPPDAIRRAEYITSMHRHSARVQCAHHVGLLRWGVDTDNPQYVERHRGPAAADETFGVIINPELSAAEGEAYRQVTGGRVTGGRSVGTAPCARCLTERGAGTIPA